MIFLAPDAVYLCARFNNQNLILCSELICHDYELQGGLHPYEINIRSKPYKHKKYIYFYIKKKHYYQDISVKKIRKYLMIYHRMQENSSILATKTKKSREHLIFASKYYGHYLQAQQTFCFHLSKSKVPESAVR